jgi:hypothetical protein
MSEEWPPELVAAMDAAFEAGVKEAAKQDSSLLFLTVRADNPSGRMWLCAYPPRSLTPDLVAVWCRSKGIHLNDGDRFLTKEEVDRAARDLGMHG